MSRYTNRSVETEGSLTMGIPSSNVHPDRVRIQIDDSRSGLRVAEITVGLEEFTRALMGMGFMPCKINMCVSDNFGMVRKTTHHLEVPLCSKELESLKGILNEDLDFYDREERLKNVLDTRMREVVPEGKDWFFVITPKRRDLQVRGEIPVLCTQVYWYVPNGEGDSND